VLRRCGCQAEAFLGGGSALSPEGHDDGDAAPCGQTTARHKTLLLGQWAGGVAVTCEAAGNPEVAVDGAYETEVRGGRRHEVRGLG
jgi:hypothetical protein